RGELDKLAKAFHAHWLASLPNDSTSPAKRPWSMLAETFKMANRRRADLVPIHLAQAGLSLVPSTEPRILRLDEEEIEMLARLEHRRWLIDRRLLPFEYSDAMAEGLQRHPTFVEWDHLPEVVREANRNEARKLSTILSDLKLEIQRVHKFF